MATSVYSSQRSKVRSDKKKVKQEIIKIISANYITDFFIQLQFNTGENRVIDFLPLFHKYVKGDLLKYLSISNFKKFKVKNGNIYWGANEDVIFTIDLLYDFTKTIKDEIIYVIK